MSGQEPPVAPRGRRLDIELVERGHAATRARARDMILRGAVTVDGAPARKAALPVHPHMKIEVTDASGAWVSRGSLKLLAALDAFGFEPGGVTALDVGASTGGFTQVLLERGASAVVAADVGHGQLHPALRDDPRVRSLEGRDARSLTRDDLPKPADAIVADVSFISLTLALPQPLSLAGRGAWMVALVKPQFEAGRAAVGRTGIVRDQTVRLAAVKKVRDWLAARPGWRIAGLMDSPIAGGSGNREYLIGARFGR